ncbi:class I SAM-dependent methyltransferase [Oculatella sp. LEGE 06141]|uniref:class I SAM-dependent methyltransferase n=1 Tax=Oculatella sp. LEGE 06141 TaxID=1828648 RepID=UPI00187FF811|nr:class I SAM-dependent methyltransferase [Oculatella sp. LEGE 06141]MBE9178802.1 class I SAM-dependent methyltransferase [Oculatella sp. LEGE 06141]
MTQQFQHAMLPQTTHDELARQKFVNSLQAYIGSQVSPKLQGIYERAKPQFEQQHQRPPHDRHEVRQLMQDNPDYHWWGALRRTTQEVMWESVMTSVDRQLAELNSRYTQLQHPHRLGSLTLHPDFELPAYQRAVDIHCMPGSYHHELGNDDVAAGAVYDRGVYLYVQGRLGPLNDGLGQALIHNYLKPNDPDWQPIRILDLGCSVGHSTLPYVDAYPNAEVHAIDVGASLLRYAHARAEALGKRVHFAQQNAEQTDFADASFDLIVSHILLHEMPGFAIQNVMKECHRLLKPGGLMAHLEASLYKHMDPFRAFLFDWETANNNEPFWSAMRDLDLEAIATDAGFATERITPTAISAIVQPAGQAKQGFGSRGSWYVLAARK